LSQPSSGSTDFGPGSPNAISTSATAAKSSRIPTWPSVSTRWRRAESWVPITQIAVITTMITQASAITAGRSFFRSSSPSRSKM
jgi:hypothetical protein